MNESYNRPAVRAMADEVIRLIEDAGGDALKFGRDTLGKLAIEQLVTGRYTSAEFQEMVTKLCILKPSLRRERLIEKATLTARVQEIKPIALGPPKPEPR